MKFEIDDSFKEAAFYILIALPAFFIVFVFLNLFLKLGKLFMDWLWL
jgi:hypothetical protein